MRRLFLLLLGALGALSQLAAGEIKTVDADKTLVASGSSAAKEMVRKALPFLEEEGTAWMEERKCTSCHQVPSMVWAFQRAAKAGLADAKKAGQWYEWSVKWENWMSPESKSTEEKAASANALTMAVLLLGRDPATPPQTPWVTQFRDHLLKNQRANGSWKADGQLPLQKRPARETEEASTLWVALALKSVDDLSWDGINRALAWVNEGKEAAKSTERLALQVLAKLEFGAPEEVKGAVAELLERQNPDGGWPFVSGDPSDAFGTGVALYAAARAGLPLTAPALQNAAHFLRQTQKADGSWDVPSTRAKDENKVRETSSYWGTCWATIGLLEFGG